MPTRSEIEAYATFVANRYGVSPSLALAVIETESGYRQNAIGGSGEVGLMQLMPSTANSLGVDPYDWQQNIEGGIRYLSQQINQFGLELGVAAYNAGPGNVSRGVIPSSTKNYIDKIFSLFSPSDTYIPTFSTTVWGEADNSWATWLLALAAGSALFILSRRSG